MGRQEPRKQLSKTEALEKQKQKVSQYIKNNPYPSYEEWEQRLNNKKYLPLLAEYGMLNHEMCKKMYENPFDEKIIIECGKRIYNSGGIQALQLNHYILCHAFNNPGDIIVGSAAHAITHNFNMVTDEWIN
jgi:hypothetical protein